jgi:hypothetical protein
MTQLVIDTIELVKLRQDNLYNHKIEQVIFSNIKKMSNAEMHDYRFAIKRLENK